MRYFMPMVALAATMTVCSAASAQDAAVAKPAQPAKEKKTCRAMVPTGTLMATRVCNTAAAWREFDGITAEGANQFRAAMRMTTTGQNSQNAR